MELVEVVEVEDVVVDVVDIAGLELVTEAVVVELDDIAVEVVDAMEDVWVMVDIIEVVEMTLLEDIPDTAEAALEDALWVADVEASAVIDIALEGAGVAVGDAA